MKTIYKIRRNSDGLYSSGGIYPKFTENGKTWTQRGHVTSHLSQLTEFTKNKVYTNCDVVEYQVFESECGVVSVLDWTPTKSTIRAKELQEQRLFKWERKQKMQEVAALEKKLADLKKSC